MTDGGYFVRLLNEAEKVKATKPLMIDLAFSHSALIPDLVAKILHLELQLSDERAEAFRQGQEAGIGEAAVAQFPRLHKKLYPKRKKPASAG